MSKTVEETFVKKTQLEHIIDLPDTYIGSVEKTELETWVLDDSNDKMIFKTISYIPGLYKIFDEVLVNAIDQHVRIENDVNFPNKVTNIKVNFDVEKNIISVYNNGEGIPIVEHKEHNVWVPELIFGHLLTSSNYDKNEKKITGGKNGYGSKLANIFSTRFVIETVDAERKLKYVQVFEKNMTIKKIIHLVIQVDMVLIHLTIFSVNLINIIMQSQHLKKSLI
jgi:DNA topoisomerase-2